MQEKRTRCWAVAALSIATLFALGGCESLPRDAEPLIPPTSEFVGPPAPVKRAATQGAPRATTAQEKRRVYSRYIERKFKVTPATAKQITEASYAAGERFKIEPSLLLAIMAVESSFDPHAFNGTDMGLMQVNPRMHAEKVAKVGGEQALYEIEKNVYVGAWVLRQIRNHSASMREALLHYCGSKRLGHSYPDRVEAQRIALEGVRPGGTRAALDKPHPT